MEDIQEVLEAQSYLAPRQIIEYMADQFTDRRLNSDDFYDILTGVFEKEPTPMTSAELGEHRDALWEKGVLLETSPQGNGFLSRDFDLPPGRHLRFYLNAHDAPGSRQILESIVEELRGHRFRIKTVGLASDGFLRNDNTLVYVALGDAPGYFDYMRRLSAKHADCFDDEVPLMSRKLGKGIGYAASPVKGMIHIFDEFFNLANGSFNYAHCMVLQATFNRVIEKGIEEFDHITSLYQDALLHTRFDPERPYLGLGMKDPLEVCSL
ncbi:hypothetical protein KY360_04840 [Candidatus Woesearchaeota archaeon]|nr:hypothetical protein [Candidatus Woesearchaeota archaeon]